MPHPVCQPLALPCRVLGPRAESNGFYKRQFTNVGAVANKTAGSAWRERRGYCVARPVTKKALHGAQHVSFLRCTHLRKVLSLYGHFELLTGAVQCLAVENRKIAVLLGTFFMPPSNLMWNRAVNQYQYTPYDIIGAVHHCCRSRSRSDLNI